MTSETKKRKERIRDEKMGRSCLPFGKAGLGYLYIESESVAIQCTLHREREKRKVSKGSALRATYRAASYAKGESSIQNESSE